MTHRPYRLLVLLPLTLAVVLSTTGCSQVANALHRTHEESFADRAAAEDGWQGVAAPEWLPADATDIRSLATNDETNAVILVRSPSALPSGCTEAERRRIPFDAPAWAPQLDRFPDRVMRCGDYEVMQVDGGWFGWFSATESGQTPTPEAR